MKSWDISVFHVIIYVLLLHVCLVLNLSTILDQSIIIHNLISRKAMFIAGMGYICVIFANLYPKPYIFVPANIIAGTGGGLFWCGEGIYLGRCSVHYSKEKKICIFI